MLYNAPFLLYNINVVTCHGFDVIQHIFYRKCCISFEDVMHTSIYSVSYIICYKTCYTKHVI